MLITLSGKEVCTYYIYAVKFWHSPLSSCLSAWAQVQQIMNSAILKKCSVVVHGSMIVVWWEAFAGGKIAVLNCSAFKIEVKSLTPSLNGTWQVLSLALLCSCLSEHRWEQILAMLGVDNSRSSCEYYYYFYWMHQLISNSKEVCTFKKYTLNKHVCLLTRLYGILLYSLMESSFLTNLLKYSLYMFSANIFL